MEPQRKLKLKKPWGQKSIGTILESCSPDVTKFLLENDFADWVKEPTKERMQR